MERKEFLAMFGLGAAAIACGACFDGCKPEDVPSAPTNVNFTLDLTAPANAALNSNGGYVYHDGIIVARTSGANYVAVSQVCTHAGSTIYFDLSINQFHCPSHGSTFATDGTVTGGPASSNLARYNTTLTGTSLRVFS